MTSEEGEATSDALCEGGVSGDSSRTLRGTAAVKHPGTGTQEPLKRKA